MKIIAFAGPAGAGKTTAARYLVENYGFERVSFAAPLKRMLAAIGLPEPATQEAKLAILPDLGVSWRHCAQTLGTEWGRTCVHPDLWVKLLCKQMVEAGGNYVFDDLRFPNEDAALRAMGAAIVHLAGRAAKMGGAEATHESERPLPVQKGDHIINNVGVLGSLFGILDHIATSQEA